MKKKTMRLMVLLIVSLSAVICLKIVGADVKIVSNIESLADEEQPNGYSTSCPGVQGARRTQAVWCGWLNYKAGCAGGAGDCYDMNPCNGEKFMVYDTWCDPEV